MSAVQNIPFLVVKLNATKKVECVLAAFGLVNLWQPGLQPRDYSTALVCVCFCDVTLAGKVWVSRDVQWLQSIGALSEKPEKGKDYICH